MAARLLRKTGEAIKHSPGALRRALTGGNRGKYQMALAQAEDPFKVGLSFQVEYVGFETMPNTDDDDGKGYHRLCDEVVARQYKQQQPPFKRLVVIVSDKRLTVFDPTDRSEDAKKKVVRIPLYRIAYCGSNTLYQKTFTFIERSRDCKTLTCHVLSCESLKKAQTMVRVVAKAFQNVYMEWQAQQRRERKPRTKSSEASGAAAPASDEAVAGAEEHEATQADVDAADAAAADLEKLDISEEEKDKRALHRTFTRRSRKSSKVAPGIELGAMAEKAKDFDLEEAAEFVDPVDLASDDKIDV